MLPEIDQNVVRTASPDSRRTNAARLLLVATSIAACTVVHVTPASRPDEIDRVCIVRNHKVVVPEFEPILEAAFHQHGVQTSLHDAAPPQCPFVLDYTARQSWDVVTFLRSAELRLSAQDGTTVALATYRHRGGFGLNKWASTRSKIDPLVAQLLGR